MNAAARALAQSSLANNSARSWVFSAPTFGLILLMLAVLASALAVIYVKELERSLFNDLQNLEQARDVLRVQTSQLLLEQNTWAAPVRVQAMAQQLGMVVPVAKDIVTIVRPHLSTK